MIKKKLYCWVCDFSKETGEGQLARFYIKKKYPDYELKIITPDIIKYKLKILNNIINNKYFSPILGITYNWIFFFNKKKTAYINYLPLWNFFIFLFLPPKTFLGPITGGAHYNSKNFIRRFLFPIFYNISKIILYFRYQKKYFSTNLLKKYFNKSFIKKNCFNFILEKININKNKYKKKIDFLIYYRKHENKIYDFPYSFIKKLRSRNYKVHVIGDRLKITGLTNHGYIENHKVKQLLKKTKYSICSNENIFSLFTIECINSNTLVLADKNKFKTLEIPNNIKNKILHVNFEKCFQEFPKKRKWM